MALFLATGPGTQGTAAALLFRNSFLRLVAGLGQVLTCVWAFAFVLALLRNAPRLRLEDVLPQRTLQADAELIKLAFQASVVYCVGVVVYVGLNWRPQDNNKDHYHAAIPPAVVQLLFFLVVLAALVLPGLAAWRQRRAFLILLLQCVSCIVGYSPLARIDFEHVLLTDILTSTSTALYDLVFAGCHFADQNFREHSVWQDSKAHTSSSCQSASSRYAIYAQPILGSLAYWLRLVQCVTLYREARRAGHVGWPATQHLANAGKYLISILGTLLVSAIHFEKHYSHATGDPTFKDWHAVIIIVLILRTMYTFVWDIAMDWAFLRGGSLLRPILLYQPTSIYYFAILVDFTVRCLWVATLQSSWCYAGCSMIFSFLEIGRRFMWVVFRVEHQALKLNAYDIAVKTEMIEVQQASEADA